MTSKMPWIIPMLVLLGLLGCELFSEPSGGSLNVGVRFVTDAGAGSERADSPLAFDRVRVIVDKEDEVVADVDLPRRGESFVGSVSVDAGWGYRVVVECYIGEQIAYQGSKSGVTVAPFATSNVEIELRLTLPAGPTNLSAAPVDTETIVVVWNDTAINEASFQIERSVVGSAAGSPDTFTVLIPDAEAFFDTTVPGDDFFRYRVRAMNSEGSSSWSNADTTSLGEGEPPLPPEDVEAETVSESTIRLIWNPGSENVASYDINQTSPSEEVIAENLPPSPQEYTVTDLDDSTLYCFEVVAVNGFGRTPSVLACAWTAPGPPDAPHPLVASAVSCDSVHLQWSNVSNETGYRIRRHVAGVGDTTTINRPANDTQYWDIGLPDRTTFVYDLTAFNDFGHSEIAGPDTVTTCDLPPDPPEGLSACAQASDRVVLSWVHSHGNEDGFIIEREQSGTFRAIDTIGIETSYEDRSPPGGIACYRVRAHNQAPEPSPPSNEDCAWVPTNWRVVEPLPGEECCQLPGDAQNVAVAEGLAIVATGVDSVFIFDVSCPTEPRLVAAQAITGNEALSVAMTSSVAFVGSEAGLDVVDLGKPLYPQALVFVPTQGPVLDLAIGGEELYLACGEAGLWKLDITNPRSPGGPLPCVESHAMAVDAWSGCAVVITDTDLCVVSGCAVSDCEELPGDCLNVSVQQTVSRAYYYGVFGEAGVKYAYSVNDDRCSLYTWSGNPFPTSWPALNVTVVADDWFYVAEGIFGVEVFDSYRHPLGSVDTPGSARAIAVAGDFGYIADGSEGLSVVYIEKD